MSAHPAGKPILSTLLAAIALLAAPCAQQQPAPSLTAEQRDVFALLDEFDPLDTSKLPFVVVVRKQDGRRIDERYGFLESAEADRFKVRYVDLCREDLRVSAETALQPGIGFEPTELRVAVAAALRQAAARAEDGDRDHYYLTPERPMPPVVEMLFLARACARSGLAGEVAQLWEALPEPCRTREGLTGEYRAHELGTALDHRLALDFADPRLSWSDLLTRHEKWLELFPHHYFTEGVIARRDALAALLATMRRREQKGRTGGTAPAELVFDLRNEFHLDAGDMANGYLVMPPERATGPGPLDRLVALGLPAVPALLAVLDDRSPTRSVVYCSRFGGGFSVQTLGEQAARALVEITGVEGYGADGAAAWRDWYERAGKRGMRALLEEAVPTLELFAVAAFLRRWPQDLDVVLDALQAPGAQGLGRNYLKVMWLLLASTDAKPDARVLALAVDGVGRVEDSWDQVFLAGMLLDLGRTEGVAAVRGSWQRDLEREPESAPLDAAVSAEARRQTEERSRRIAAGGERLRFLMQHCDAATWSAIAAACRRADVRAAVAGELNRLDWPAAKRRMPAAERAAAESALRACLLQLLADDAVVDAPTRVWHAGRSVELHRATCADLAASRLSDLWPAEYAFDPAQSATRRHRQILILRGENAAAALEPAVLPGETPDQARQRANCVASVTLDPSAAALPAGAQQRLRGLQGKHLNAAGLATVVIATAAAAEHRTVVFSCERNGDGSGTSLAVMLRADAEAGQHGGWSVRVLATAGGVQFGGGALQVTSGTLQNPEQLDEYEGRYLGAIRKALASEAATGVEITFELRFE